MSEKILQLDEEVIKGQIKELVRGSVEDITEALWMNMRHLEAALEDASLVG